MWEVSLSIPLIDNWRDIEEQLEDEFSLEGDSGCGLGYRDRSSGELSEESAKKAASEIESFCRERGWNVNEGEEAILVSVDELE